MAYWLLSCLYLCNVRYLMVNIWFRSTCRVDNLFRKPGCPRPEGPDLRRGPPQGPGAGLAAGPGPALAPMTERYASFSFLP